MSLSESVQGAGRRMKEGFKSTTIFVINLLLRSLSGFFLGLTLALIGQQIMNYETLGLIMILLATLVVFMKISAKWSIIHVLIFDLVCILVGQILKMYILLAP